ncbi:MAG: type II toxin-antitoxin system RelE/ParE family toxin [Candidatus Anstonellales archaeon]
MREFRIIIHKQVIKQLRKLDARIRNNVKKVLVHLQYDPVPAKSYDIKKLSKGEGHYRIRIGKFRVLYWVDFTNYLIVVTDIKRRDETTYK